MSNIFESNNCPVIMGKVCPKLATHSVPSFDSQIGYCKKVH